MIDEREEELESLSEQAEIARLKAEVERLRKVVADLAPPLEGPGYDSPRQLIEARAQALRERGPAPAPCHAHVAEGDDKASQCVNTFGHSGDHKTADGHRWWNPRSGGGRWRR